MSEYNSFADLYDQTFKLSPIRTHVEAYSMFRQLGDVDGQTWLDLACGTGPYARSLRQRGARRVIGVDLSVEMLRVARAAEQREPLGVEYLEYDIGSMPKLGEYDGALGAHLLQYATSEQHLRDMCRNISANLRSGGRFLSYQFNPDFSRQPDYYSRYSTELDVDPDRELADGDPITFRVVGPNMRTPDVTIHYWSRATLENALQEAGFGAIRWTKPRLSESARQAPDAHQWDDYLDVPLCVVIEARR